MKRSVRLGLALGVVALMLTAGGAITFRRFVRRAQSDPGLLYRDPATLAKVLQRARDAEAHGDRPSAIVGYRFIAAVGAGGDSTIAQYVAAARAGLERLTPPSFDTLRGPPR